MKHQPFTRRTRVLTDDPTWYKDAIIYELRVRSFMDGNGDGIGDFPGLTSQLDYLEDLGVTALWLLPFYPSPGRDDGYDTADYTSIHPELGTLDDFRQFLDEAHRRGLRVITELVLNHTSDQHPWFQRARRAPPGSPERDFYVWSDTPDRYTGTRIIFKDFEPSNWSWDPVAKAYFWHRFYAHQPDLNFDNPAVHAAMFEVVDFWFKLGVDGLRLDAVPYLYEREGTSCENLPETHEFLKRLRKHIDERFDNRMLLAEANQWPEDAAAYFGDGDECHMNFHFPIMPRLFMSIHMEDRFPIIDILEQTPALDETSQWAVFLRNHDELTLEMVTEEERDYMWRAFAREATMRINLGIRRRLAPLVGNDRRNIELMNGLLFSMPGTPVLYYGDEIGMGDNVYLGDRNGVRTPMQWSSDRNAGFSRANPQKLVLPVIIDPEYHFESVNVEAQQNNTNSMLWWMKRLIALRKRFRAFGRGTIHFLSPDNPRVLAFIREHEDERVLVVANLSRHIQYVELDLSAYEGMTPIELFGRNVFPRIGELPYLLTLGGHAFYWFALERPESAEAEERAAAYEPRQLEIREGFPGLLSAEHRGVLEEVLATYVTSRRWYTGDGDIAAVRLTEALPLGASRQAHLLLVRFEYVRHEAETYVVPVAFAVGDDARSLHNRAAHAIIADITFVGDDGGPAYGALYDAFAEPATSVSLLELMDQEREVRGVSGDLHGIRHEELCGEPDHCAGARQVRGDRPSPPVVYGERLLFKLIRRLHDGVSPEVEIKRFLLGRAERGEPVAPAPPLAGVLEVRPRGGKPPITVGVVHRFVPHEADARSYTLEEIGRFLERTLSHELDVNGAPRSTGKLVELARKPPAPEVEALVGAFLDTAQLLGLRTAEIHRALVSDTEPEFTADPFTGLDQRSLYQSLRNLSGTVLRSLRGRVDTLDQPAATLARDVMSARAGLYQRFAPLLDTPLTAARCRYHGDLHLGKWLFTGRDFVVTDFEGDRSRPLTERRRKRSPLRDVAAMLRSFHHAAYSAVLDPGVVRETDRAEAEAWARAWLAAVCPAYLGSYLAAAQGGGWLPRDDAELQLLLDVFQLERVLRELEGAMAVDGGRLLVPLLGLARQLEDGR